MSDFDDIVNGQPDDNEDAEKELANIWEGLAHIWPHFYPGYLIKGVILAEYIDEDGEKVMRFVSSPDVAPWELLGMIESARLDARDISMGATWSDPNLNDEND